MPTPNLNRTIHFGKFMVTPHIFHITSHSFALVNLKPLLPGHVLVCPQRVVARVRDLTSDEAADLFLTIQKVGRMVEQTFKATSLNIAIQDGEAAGQSVPHVHAHIIPRKPHDMDAEGGSDAIYEKMDSEENNIAKNLTESSNRGGFAKPDAERRARTDEELREEAGWLAEEMNNLEA